MSDSAPQTQPHPPAQRPSASKPYRLVRVVQAEQVRAFHEVPRRVYADDPVWVSPIEEQVEDLFTPGKNPRLKKGKAIRWVVLDAKNRPAGRIAAFWSAGQKEGEEPVGSVGFFESVNDLEAAKLLFDAARKWLTDEGFIGMDGPVNFGENDSNWGLLVHGFTHPSFGMNYNPPYYQGLWESYGFRVYYEQVSKHLDITRPVPERFQKIYDWVRSKPGVEFKTAKKSQLMQFGADFRDIYNEAWKFHEDFVEMGEEAVKRMVDQMKHVVIEDFLVFAYVNGDPAGFLFALPDLNQIFKPLKGKFGLWQKLLFKWRSRNNFAWYRRRGVLNRGRVVVIGVKPKYQKYGLESGLTLFSMGKARDMGFHEFELSWVGDFNPMSRSLQDATGAQLAKIHCTYRIMFDPQHDWQRSKILDSDPRKQKNAEEE